MPEDQGDIIKRLRLAGTLTDNEIQQLSRLLEKGVSQDVSQSGKFNVAVGEGTNIHVGDRHNGTSIKEIRAIVQELTKLQEPHTRLTSDDNSVTSFDDLPLTRITLDPSTLETINTKLDLIEEIATTGYFVDTHQQELNELKQQLQNFRTLSQDLQCLEERGNRLIESAVAEMRQQLADLKLRAEDLTAEALAKLAPEDLECRQAGNQLLENFVSRLEDSRLGADWIDRNIDYLKKYGCKQVLVKFPELNLPEKRIHKFQLSLKHFLEQVSFCLYWGTYSILDSPDIPFELEVEHYETAFIAIKKLIKKRVSSQLRDETLHAIEACFDHLIEQLPFIDVE